jgi:5,10-methylenetetrahydrofolate reductase
MLTWICVNIPAIHPSEIKYLRITRRVAARGYLGAMQNPRARAAPNANPLEAEILKIERKVKLGVDFIQTQCVYSVEQAKHFMEAVSYLKTPVLIGIAPFKSQAMMDWMIKFVPGIKVPPELEQQLRKAREKGKEAFLEENIQVFADLMHDIRKETNVAGLHLMAVGFEAVLPKIIEKSGILSN